MSAGQSTYSDIRRPLVEWLDTAPPGARKVFYRGDLDADKSVIGRAVRATLAAIEKSKAGTIEFDPGIPGDPRRPQRYVVTKGGPQ